MSDFVLFLISFVLGYLVFMGIIIFIGKIVFPFLTKDEQERRKMLSLKK